MPKLRFGDGPAEHPPLGPALERGVLQELGAVGDLTSVSRYGTAPEASGRPRRMRGKKCVSWQALFGRQHFVYLESVAYDSPLSCRALLVQNKKQSLTPTLPFLIVYPPMP